MYYPILGMEPIVAFFLLHSILFFLIIVIFGLSNVKKLEGIKTYLNKTNALLFLVYLLFHIFCFCIIFLSVFVSSISTSFWLVLYIKFLIAMGVFAATICIIGVFLLPFGLFAITLNAIKNIIKL